MRNIKKNNFKGGVHPPEGKHFTEKESIQEFGLPDKLYIPMSQHIGAPAKPIVEKGDTVLKGQMIGEAAGFISANIHSSTSGTVVEIGQFVSSLGAKVTTVVIEPDGEDKWIDRESRDWRGLTKEAMIEIVKSHGIVGMGGATFPTHVKLNPPPGTEIDTLIINAAECEPYLTADHRLMLEYADNIIEGVKLTMKILGVSKAAIGIESNKPDAIELLRSKADNKDIKVLALEVKYPQGAEKQLIYAATKREVPSAALPSAAKVVVLNVGTVNAIYEAIVEDKPLIERITTVTGSIVAKPTNFKIKTGVLVKDLMEKCLVDFDSIGKLILGGPMMGHAISSENYPAGKGTSGVLSLSKDETPDYEEGPCISCGRCVDVCPIELVPTELATLSLHRLYDEADKNSAMDCIECGCCTYTCPSRIYLAQHIKIAKVNIIKNKRKNSGK